MLVVAPADEGVANKEVSKVKDFIVSNNGKVKSVDNWGVRKLAYTIDGVQEGYYVIITFLGAIHIKRTLNIYLTKQSNVIRHLVIQSKV